MDLGTMMKLMPLMDRIHKALTTVQGVMADPEVPKAIAVIEKYEADPDVKEAIATFTEASAILAASRQS